MSNIIGRSAASESIPGGAGAWGNWLAGIVAVYGTLFGTGKIIFGYPGQGVVLLAIALSALAHALWFGAPVGLLAAILLVAIIVGTRRGRWLLVTVAALLALALGTVGVFGAHLGTRTYHVTSVNDLRSDYDYAAGKVNLDLSALTGVTGRHRTDIRLGRGDVNVTVPQGVPVVVHGQSGLGTVEIDGHAVKGVDAEQDVQVLSSMREIRIWAVVDVIVGVGKVTVRGA